MKTVRYNEKVLLELKNKGPKGWSIPRLYEEIKDKWGEDALDYTTLWRGLKGLTRLGRDKQLYIATALEKTPQELRKGTNEEEKMSRYSYNEHIYLEYEQTPLPYLTAHLFLLSNAKTVPESDPSEYGNIGKVIKAKFLDIDPNAQIILNDLIQKGILAETSFGEIYLVRKKGQFVTRPVQLSGSNFDIIWDTLAIPPFTKWLHAKEGETICFVETDQGVQEFHIAAKAEGTVKKSEFIKIDPNGSLIVEGLINQGVLEEDLDIKKVRLKRKNSQYISRPSELTHTKFDTIWQILQRFQYIYFDSTLQHHFENRSGKKAECILIQNPKYIA